MGKNQNPDLNKATPNFDRQFNSIDSKITPGTPPQK